jgi:hypothetical protein
MCIYETHVKYRHSHWNFEGHTCGIGASQQTGSLLELLFNYLVFLSRKSVE